jgi:signal transduction histidine kinase
VSSEGDHEIAGEVEPGFDLDATAMINSIGAGILVCDAMGNVVAVNTVGLHMLGARSLDELRTKLHVFDSRLEDGRPVPPNWLPLRRVLAGEELVDELEFLDAAGRRAVHRVRATPLRSPRGSILGAVKVILDVTKEYELSRTKDDFIRTAAHELKTPLAVIMANADAALEALKNEVGPAGRALTGLRRGIERVDRLITSLLDLLDIEGGLFSLSRLPVRLDDLIGQAISRLPHDAGARVHIIDTSPIVVQGDEARLRRAVYAILDNALKYSPKTRDVELSLRLDGESALISIRDHGIGIPPDKQARIFEKYFRAHAGTAHDVGGIGVGLFVAREIVAQHGGRLWFESVENEGTQFFIQVPMQRTAR